MKTQEEQGSADLQECFKCPSPSTYILNPDVDACMDCPPGLTCSGDATLAPKIDGSVWVEQGSFFRLESCPPGYFVWPAVVDTLTAGTASQQECRPCLKGEECTDAACLTCSPCLPGYYKAAISADPCLPCPANTYREQEGASELSMCVSCPAGADTRGLTNRMSNDDCECEIRMYGSVSMDGAGQLQCNTCPIGAECSDRALGCGLRTPDFVCELMGTWIRDKETDKFRLTRCPVGYKLENSTGHDNLACIKCNEGYYVQDPSDPKDICRKCPFSAECVNGGPPIFQAKRVSGEIELTGLPEGKEGEAAVRQALADLLGVDVSQIVLPEAEADRRQQNARKVVFEITGTAGAAAALNDKIKSGALASQLSSQLSREYSLNVTVQVFEKPVDPLPEFPEGSWLEVGGAYLLQSCPQGYLLVNTTIELSLCKECLAGSYSFSFSDGCDVEQGICDTRDCTPCPVGVTCSEGRLEGWKHFVPRAIRIGGITHPYATLRRSRNQESRFLCGADGLACTPVEASGPLSDEEGSYAWEYVATCTAESMPCNPDHVPAVYLRRCPAGTRLINSTMSGKFDPALQECSPCNSGNYIVDPLHPGCLKCPAGAECPDGAQFVPKVAGSEWTLEIASDGTHMRRLSKCPRGHALLRTESLPQADTCEVCPGTADTGYSLTDAVWNGNENETGLAFFCNTCPRPAHSVTCRGSSQVEAKAGWWLVEEEVVTSDDRRSSTTVPLRMFKTYQCDPAVCEVNNTCASGRTGVACGSCPDNHVLQVGICVQCAEQSPKQLLLWRAIFCVVGALLVGLVWFLLAWAPVFGGTANGYIRLWFAWPIRMINRCNRVKAAAHAAYAHKKQVQNFFSNPKNVKLFQQYLKVFIAYMQVLGSFVTFKVKWPGSLGSAIGWVLNIASVIKFDFMELPGLACLWSSYSYSHKYYIKMATPLFVALMLGLPLYVAQRMKKRQQAQAQAKARQTPTPGETVDGDVEGDVEAGEDPKVDWRVRLSDTINVFWNNIMFWLFMVRGLPPHRLLTLKT